MMMPELSLVTIIGNIVLAASNTVDSLWPFFIVILIVTGFLLGTILLVFSSKPKDWRHIPINDEFFQGGRLKYLGDSIKFVSQDPSSSSLLKNHIQILFFEKVRANYGLSLEELMKMKMEDPNKLRKIIHDDSITDWILDSKPSKRGFFRSDREEKKKDCLSEINLILNKMEVWGK